MVYILTILPFYTTSAAYRSNWFGCMLYYIIWFPDDGPLRAETCKNIPIL